MLPRFILAADHRTPFEEYVEQHRFDRDRVRQFKTLVVQALAEARRTNQRARQHAGLLLDPPLGLEAIALARREGIPCGEPLEHSGVRPLGWVEGGYQAVALRRPAFAKVLVQVPLALPDQPKVLAMLLEAQDHLRGAGIPLVIEVVAEGPDGFAAQIEGLSQMVARGLAPKLWKVSGSDDPRRLDRLVEVARTMPMIFLGGGESVPTLHRFFRAASSYPSIIGFAVGRTLFWDPFEAWAGGAIGDQDAAQRICGRYLDVLSGWPE